MSGPLAGMKVIELAGIGPAPMATMLLGDLGAQVLRITRPGGHRVGMSLDPKFALLNRGKHSIELDFKSSVAIEQVLTLVEQADVLVEGYRPGVVERLGLGPDICLTRNPRVVYGRITGWGRDGPLAQVAGHDLNYIALSGALAAIGPRGKPAIPLNLLGDFGGGALYLAFGIMSALFERQTSGKGQVVDAAMVDGVASLMTSLFAQHAGGTLRLERESNLLDGGAPFYDVYQTADGLWVSVAAIEPKFFAQLVELLGLDASWTARQYERACWPELRVAIQSCFASRDRAAWCDLLEHRDVCFAPVLNMEEAARHAHHVQRGTFTRVDGAVQPSPSPHFGRTPTAPAAAVRAKENPDAVLRRWGLSPEDPARFNDGDTGANAHDKR